MPITNGQYEPPLVHPEYWETAPPYCEECKEEMEETNGELICTTPNCILFEGGE